MRGCFVALVVKFRVRPGEVTPHTRCGYSRWARPGCNSPVAEPRLLKLEEKFHTQFDVAGTPSTGDLGIAHLRAGLSERYRPSA